MITLLFVGSFCMYLNVMTNQWTKIRAETTWRSRETNMRDMIIIGGVYEISDSEREKTVLQSKTDIPREVRWGCTVSRDRKPSWPRLVKLEGSVEMHVKGLVAKRWCDLPRQTKTKVKIRKVKADPSVQIHGRAWMQTGHEGRSEVSQCSEPRRSESDCEKKLYRSVLLKHIRKDQKDQKRIK